jgi:hypothetical protein
MSSVDPCRIRHYIEFIHNERNSKQIAFNGLLTLTYLLHPLLGVGDGPMVVETVS